MAPGRARLFLLVVIYLGFISLGLPDGTLGVAWPQAHVELRLPIGLAGTIMIVATLLAAASGFSSGRLVGRFNTGPVVLASCLLTGAALVLLSRAQTLASLLLAAVPLGLGAGAVDASLNGYVARHYTGRHMNWLHACWGIGATCGPLVMAEALTRAGGWRSGYLVLGGAQLTLALIFLLTLGLWGRVPERTVAAHAARVDGRTPVAAANSVAGWLSTVIFALYVAVEMTTGLWASSILVVSRGFSQETGGWCAAAYYGAITLGRILVGTVVDRWGNRRLIAVGGFAALAGALLFALGGHTTPVAAGALILMGLGFAPVYPCLMHEVPRRFAPEAVQVVIGRQSGAAGLGGAFLPAAAGWIAQVSLEAVAWAVIAGIVALSLSLRRLDRMT
ncbi:MAG TPA: MFS transporter [Opitutaceae bacterium]